MSLVKIGTNYGGWYVPNNMKLNYDSIVYCAGAGEDISFDLNIQSLFNCDIHIFDPTKRAKDHYMEILNYYKSDKKDVKFSGDIQPDYLNCIEKISPRMDKIYYHNIGLWNHTDIMKFYKQSNKNYVSQSLIDNMFSSEYDIVKVDTIKNIMIQNGHSHIDLLKMDIEGAEVNTIEKMLDDHIYPTYLLVEFDLLIKRKDDKNLTKSLIEKLLRNHGYSILKNDRLNITFYKAP